MSTTQSHQTDLLQQQPDSSPLLRRRLESWKDVVEFVLNYVSNVTHLQNDATSTHEKTVRLFEKTPQFSGSDVNGSVTPSQVTDASGSGQANANSNAVSTNFSGNQTSNAVTNAGSTEGSSHGTLRLTEVFNRLRGEAETHREQSRRADTELNQIHAQLRSLLDEVEQSFKTLTKTSTKGNKEIEKTRENSQKLVEKLGKVSASATSTSNRLEPKDDPYVLRRRLVAGVHEQLSHENTQAGASLELQTKFARLESHIVTALQSALTSLSKVQTRYLADSAETHNRVAKQFNQIDPHSEWKNFMQANSEELVPEENYIRKPENVSYPNKDNELTVPVLEGILERRGTVLRSFNQGFYVITPTGYLHQFKTADSAATDLQPELSLYLPECQVGRISEKPGDYRFIIVGKDNSSKLSRSHKYHFRASSPADVNTWYEAIVRTGGQTIAESHIEDHEDHEEESEPVSPVSAEPVAAVAVPANTQPETASNVEVRELPADSDVSAVPVQPTSVEPVHEPAQSHSHSQTQSHSHTQTQTTHEASPVVLQPKGIIEDGQLKPLDGHHQSHHQSQSSQNSASIRPVTQDLPVKELNEATLDPNRQPRHSSLQQDEPHTAGIATSLAGAPGVPGSAGPLGGHSTVSEPAEAHAKRTEAAEALHAPIN